MITQIIKLGQPSTDIHTLFPKQYEEYKEPEVKAMASVIKLQSSVIKLQDMKNRIIQPINNCITKLKNYTAHIVGALAVISTVWFFSKTLGIVSLLTCVTTTSRFKDWIAQILNLGSHSTQLMPSSDKVSSVLSATSTATTVIQTVKNATYDKMAAAAVTTKLTTKAPDTIKEFGQHFVMSSAALLATTSCINHLEPKLKEYVLGNAIFKIRDVTRKLFGDTASKQLDPVQFTTTALYLTLQAQTDTAKAAAILAHISFGLMRTEKSSTTVNNTVTKMQAYLSNFIDDITPAGAKQLIDSMKSASKEDSDFGKMNRLTVEHLEGPNKLAFDEKDDGSTNLDIAIQENHYQDLITNAQKESTTYSIIFAIKTLFVYLKQNPNFLSKDKTSEYV